MLINQKQKFIIIFCDTFQWTQLVIKEYTRVIFLCVEDARLARAAICAAKNAYSANSATSNGRNIPFVWLICSLLPRDWLQPDSGENCTFEELKEVS